MSEKKNWWGSYELERGECLRWRVAPLSVDICRAPREWQLVYSWDETLTDSPGWEARVEAGELGVEMEQAERHVLQRSGNELSFLPALSDRPVVTSPRMPVYVAPEQEATLFVGSPLWVRVETVAPEHRLTELPIRRPSDTWFGSSTLEGELCYASKTRAVLDVANLPRLSRQAITPVLIRNEATEPLQIDSLKLPVPLLSIYEDSAGQLWTDEVTMIRTDDSAMARVEIRKKKVPRASSATLLTRARETAEEGLLIRAFSGLFQL